MQKYTIIYYIPPDAPRERIGAVKLSLDVIKQRLGDKFKTKHELHNNYDGYTVIDGFLYAFIETTEDNIIKN